MELSKSLTSCPTAIKIHVIRYCEKAYERSEKMFLSIKSSPEVIYIFLNLHYHDNKTLNHHLILPKIFISKAIYLLEADMHLNHAYKQLLINI